MRRVRIGLATGQGELDGDAVQKCCDRVAAGFGQCLQTLLVRHLVGDADRVELDDFRERLALATKQAKGPDFAAVGEEVAAKIRKYMLVRTQMSALTGFAVWGWAHISGLELAPAWGIIAFVVNYIPFIGSFVATLLPSVFAVAQFGTLHDSLFVFLGMFAIQFGIGNYLEPLVAGKALAISPLAVVFAVFFFGFLWGMPGAFLGVPILIAIVTLCAHYPSTRWIATLLSGAPQPREQK